MATFFGSPPYLSHPPTRTHHLSTSSSPSPPPPLPPSNLPPSQSQSQSPPPTPSLRTSSEQQTSPAASVKLPQKSQAKSASSSNNNVADSTDWIASSLTRRFGLGAGLAWAAFLAVGVVSEQIKTRLEVSQQEANTRDVEKQEEVVLPNGIRYYDIRVGGGATPRPGDLVVIDLKGHVQGTKEEETFVDTFGREMKPLALVVGSRPYTKGMCEGIEYVLRSMKAGGKRKVIIPPSLGFGEKGADLGLGATIPPFATLEYIVEVERVSIAPA